NLALSDVAIAVAGHLGLLAEAALVAEPRGRFGNDLFGTYGRDFETRDGRHVMVTALTPRQWKSLGEATGLTAAFGALEETHGVDLADEGARFVHRREISGGGERFGPGRGISERVEPWVRARSLDEVGAAFDRHGVLWGPYRTFKELL